MVRTAAQINADPLNAGSVDLRDLASALQQDRGALLLDVRTTGEFRDTSRHVGLNMGHLERAMNVPVDSIGTRFPDLLPYRNRPIYVYCSHSQRSRRVRDQLVDSGFTVVHNVNEGLSGYWHDRVGHADLAPLIRTDLPYRLEDPYGLCTLLSTGGTTVLDVRPDSLFAQDHVSERTRAMGHIANAIHIPLSDLSARLDEIPSDRPTLVVDDHGMDSPKAALMLVDAGFQEVHVLFDGLDALLSASADQLPCLGTGWLYDRPYRNVTLGDLDTTSFRNSMLVLDVRPDAEYDGTATPAWKNVGRIPFALHVPADAIGTTLPGFELFPDDPVLVVGRSNDEMVYRAALKLCALGFTRVNVLADGIGGMRWAVRNHKGMAPWSSFLDSPGH